MVTLLPNELGLPLEWLPDETLFSLCSRYHKASGNRLASSTCQTLFGHPKQGSAHDFPARLDHFSQAAGPALGSADSIVEHHTMLPLYLRFANPTLAQNAVSAARANSSGRLKFQLGLLTSRFRANHPLKACPTCMQEDYASFGTAYWHREHQFPGVWICRAHGCMLFASDLKATGISRFHWMLPSLSQFSDRSASSLSPTIIELADMVCAVGTRAGLQLRPDKLARAFRHALGQRGFLKGASGRLTHAAAGSSYVEFLKPLLCVEQLGALPASVDSACTDIARQIGPKAFAVHPIRRLALATWLFRDLDELLAKSVEMPAKDGRKNQTPSHENAQATSAATLTNRREEYFLHLSSGQSTSLAARLTGIDTNTAMAWSASRGIASARRPKVLKGDLRASLIAMLRKGAGKRTAASFGNVSLQAITTLLRTEVGLHEAWKQAVFKDALRRNRRRWIRVTTTNPISGVKAARVREPAVYAWLYRNDRDWLRARANEMPKATRNVNMRVDWDVRDRGLADQVRQVALRLITEEKVRQIRLPQLYQKIPELKAKLSKLDRLPLTMAAIYQVLK